MKFTPIAYFNLWWKVASLLLNLALKVFHSCKSGESGSLSVMHHSGLYSSSHQQTLDKLLTPLIEAAFSQLHKVLSCLYEHTPMSGVLCVSLHNCTCVCIYHCHKILAKEKRGFLI